MNKGMTEIKESKEDELESQKAQEVIGLLLSKPDEECSDVLSFPAVCKSEPDLPSSSITVAISDASPLNICQVSLTDAAGLILEPSDILRQSLDGASSIQLEDGTTAFVQSFEPVDETDSGDTTARFIDGQAVQLEDGSTAFIHAAPREGLQPVQLEDGTMAYLSQTGADLFNGEASTLDLEHISTAQLVDAEVKEMDLKVESFNKSTATKVAEKAFQCEYANCKRLYTTLHHLKVHERSHTGDRPFKCKSCTKSFATGYGLKSHTRVHTGETPYKCPDEACQKAFKTSGDLQKHVRTHTGERPFKCPFSGCDRAFTTSNIRKVHIRTHTGERPYTCKEEGCGRAFASATNYKNHIRIHTGEKPYLCAVSGCNKRFTEYSSLYKHHVVHTHFKPYACNLCGKNYRQTSTLAMHKRNAHGILEQAEEEEMITDPSNFRCNLCEEIFPQASALITHKESAHGILEQNDVEKMIAEPEIKTEERIELKKIAISPLSKTKEQENNNKSTKVLQDPKESSSAKTTFPTIVALQGESSTQLLQEHSVYAVQLQEDGTLSSNMQQIVLVTDSQQLATLQQLAQQGQLETILATTDGNLSSNPA